MAKQSNDDPAASVNQGLPETSKLDCYGTGSPSSYKKSPERQQEKSLGVHVDPYGPRKDRAST
jgi:hypothetical protein